MARLTIPGLALVMALAGSGFAWAQSNPTWNPTAPVNPTALAVHENQLLDNLEVGETIHGRVSIPDKALGQLEKPSNKLWTELNLDVFDWLLIAAVLVTLACVVVFYFKMGRLAIDRGRSGRTITRFNLFERVMHWTMASSFIVLALSGINVAIGRYILQPFVSESLFGTLTYWGKLAHHYLAWPFLICVVLTFLIWIRHNIPNKLDIAWFKAGGGMLKNGAHPDAGKFNAGQKVVFWAVVLGGGVIVLSGLAMMFPYFLQTAVQWQFAQVLHAIAAAGLIAMVIGHIYIATAGSEGALEAMTTGEVDLNWAKQHHSLWVKEELAKGVVPRVTPGATPAE